LEEAWGEFTHQVYEDKDAPNYLVKSYQLLSEYLNVINKQVEFLKTTYQTLSKEQVNRSIVENTNFEDKGLNFLDLSNFHLRNLNFIDCNCFTFSLKESTLYAVSFDRCSLMNFDFTGSFLKRVKFLHSKGTRYIMNLKFKCTIDNSEFNQIQLMNTDFGNVKCRDTTFVDASFMNTDFYNAVFERCTFLNVDFFNLFNAENLKFIGCHFDNVTASGAGSEEFKVIINKART
jgi:uncharacterized protein YjbI with pentapeptide repeats